MRVTPRGHPDAYPGSKWGRRGSHIDVRVDPTGQRIEHGVDVIVAGSARLVTFAPREMNGESSVS